MTVPSSETIICREVMLQSTVTLRISNPNKSVADFAINYGVTDALPPFPLHSLVSVMSCTINHNTVNLNVQDSQPLLLRMVDPKEFSQYGSMTPTAL
ncbi:MAG: phage major capsid domain-containing protein, partial [Candidatus Fonsibacter sp.]